MIARFRRTISLSVSLPIRAPSLVFGIVVILSTINREITLSPFVSLGSMAGRKSGASVGSLVKAQMVMELVALNRSS